MRGGQFGRQIAKDRVTCGLHGMTGRTVACMEGLVHASSKTFVYFHCTIVFRTRRYRAGIAFDLGLILCINRVERDEN